MWKDILDIVSFLSNSLTIVASGIAIWLFWKKGRQLSLVFRLLINYSTQISLRELTDKLEELNELRVADDAEEIINIFHEIVGQIKGNPKLSENLKEIIVRVEKTIAGKKGMSEPTKRSLVSELREKLRHINLMTLDDMSGSNA